MLSNRLRRPLGIVVGFLVIIGVCASASFSFRPLAHSRFLDYPTTSDPRPGIIRRGGDIAAARWSTAMPPVAATRDRGNNPYVRIVLLERFPMASRDAAPLHNTDDNRREKDIQI